MSFQHFDSYKHVKERLFCVRSILFLRNHISSCDFLIFVFMIFRFPQVLSEAERDEMACRLYGNMVKITSQNLIKNAHRMKKRKKVRKAASGNKNKPFNLTL